MQADLHQSMRHLIDRSLAGELAPKEQQSLREHLRDCASCQKYADDSRRAIAALGGFSFTVDLDLQSKVFAALAQRAQQLETAQPSPRRNVRTCIFALLLTIVGSFGALHMGDPLAALLHLPLVQAQAGLFTLWIVPSWCFALLLPVLLLVSARSANKKGRIV